MKTEFKIGDWVTCVCKEALENNYFKKGEKHLVTFVSDQHPTVKLNGNSLCWNSERFDLVKEEFCMKSNSWFIKTKDKKQFDVVSEFLKSKGFFIDKCQTYVEGFMGFSNTTSGGVIISACGVNRINNYDLSAFINKKIKEIKIDFETKIKSVTYPIYAEIKSEKDIEIEKIQEEMKKLSDRLNKLKGE